MPRMQFGISAFQRARGDLTELPVVNMFAEASTEETGVALQSFPGHSALATTMGSQSVKSLFQADGVLDSELYGVAGSALYQGGTSLGAVDGGGPFSLAGFSNLLFTAGGQNLWGYNGTTLSQVTFPDNAYVTKVLIGASRLIAIRADTQTFYWSDPLTSDIDGLSFASAESQPDRLRDAVFIDGILVLGGAETVEFWPATSDEDLPFQALPGRVFEKGVKQTGCMVRFGSTFAWVTNQNQVCLSEPENIISEPGLEALIEESETVRLQTFRLEGTDFLWLKIDAGDWAYSLRSGKFSQLVSYGEDGWRATCAVGSTFGGPAGALYEWASDHQDLGGVLERRFRAGFALNSGGVTINNIILRTNPGRTPFLTGDYADPVVEMRVSRDAGETWGIWRRANLGTQGKYRKKVQWTGLGMAGAPGFLAEFRVTDPVGFRVSDVLFNEPFGGI